MQIEVPIPKALERKYPEPVVLVVSVSKDGKPNAMAVGWYCIVSYEPFMFAVCIDSEAYTYQLIQETGDFVVAFPSEKQAKETLFLGTHHGHKLDKIERCKLKLSPASKIKSPLVADAVANFECVKEMIYQPGNCPIIIGKVVAAHINSDTKLQRLYTVAKNYKLSGVVPAR